MKTSFRLFVLLLVLSGIRPAHAQRFSGLVFGDYYYVVSNHQPEREAQNGFWLRRVYFTLDQQLGDNLSMRLRMEMAHPGNFSAGNAVPFVKDAYLRWKFTANHELFIGISPSATFNLVESVWGYRPVEKTPDDLYKLASSREFGLALRGKLVSSGKLRYHALLGNGEGTKSEGNKGKKVQLALQFFPTDELVLEVYGDYARRQAQEQVYTGHVFAAYRTATYRLGIEYSHQRVQRDVERDLRYLSGFAALQAGRDLYLFGRVDRLFDANPQGERISYLPMADNSRATFVLAGIDYRLHEKVHVMPNVEIVLYDNSDLDRDVMPRLTFFYRF